jgi:membrane-associated phospholipid phosphatase
MKHNQTLAESLSQQRTSIAHLGLGMFLCCLLGMSAFSVDFPIMQWVQADNIKGDVAKLLQLAEVFAHGAGVACILLVIASVDSRGWRVLPRLAILAFGAGLLANAVKLLIARQRPEFFAAQSSMLEPSFMAWFWSEQAPAWFNRDYRSFPSGHTATAVGLAVGLTRFYPQGKITFGVLAILAGLQRIEASAHFLSDVFFGAAVGFIWGSMCEIPFCQHLLSRLENKTGAIDHAHSEQNLARKAA